MQKGRKFIFLALVTGPGRSSSLKLSDTRVYEPQIRARLVTKAHFCEGVVVKLCPDLVARGGLPEVALPKNFEREHERKRSTKIQ